MLKRAILAAVAMCFPFGGTLSSVIAADAPKDVIQKNTFLEPSQATKDFAVQGEYIATATIGGKATKVAAQIASTGGGEFVGAFYLGGLPGAGWDGVSRFEITGKADSAEMKRVVFAPTDPKGFSAVWADGKLSAKGTDVAIESMEKTERKSTTLGAKAPSGAIVLFDGTDAEAWEGGHIDDRKLLAAGAKTRKKFQSFTLHGEFLLPFKPYGRDQDRGNSGFYLQERYEVQVLDTFSQKPVFNGTGALYRQSPPDLNMCLPPLQWQTYDIDFTAPVFEGGKKVKNAVITVKLNGVTVHDKREITAKTGAGKPEGAEPGPILLQGHGNPVFYRNIWIVEK
ncbi:3-keto-disaccharide hydrolase [Humisphaera borealis]|uniref:DUF1080 domain-containing protein n=1 Tax=Humisphaera borealis TaxID=2807512 RepID=A0A7M2X0M9_9BACT|nr:DUF1080 domain-containing protein [Humisphaera borealis]QOV91243.1 DUF1080 domain-containing protein [Humisphaera borealis]